MDQAKLGGTVVSRVWKLAEPIANTLSLKIWDIRFLKEGSTWYLRIYIDKETGVTIEDCEAMSRAIDQPLDALDPIDQAYCLEVCSPGIQRELVREEHFQQFLNQEVILRLIRHSEQGKKEICGVLSHSDKQTITIIQDQNETLQLNKKDLAWVKVNDFRE